MMRADSASSAERIEATLAFSSSGVSPWNGWPSARSEGFCSSPSSPPVQHTSTVWTPSAWYRATVGAPFDASSSGWAWTESRVRRGAALGSVISRRARGALGPSPVGRYPAPCLHESGHVRSPAVPARSIVTAAVATVLVVIAAACDTDDGKTLRPPTSSERVAMPTTTTSTTVPGTGLDAGAVTSFPGLTGSSGIATAPFTMIVPWAEGAAIDAAFTCDGADVSPLISWTAPPAGTVEMALLMVDESADFIHWAVVGIPPTAGQKPQGTPFAGAIEGTNSFGNVGYQGPCPPAGAAHTYRFMLYALSQQAELPDVFTGQDLESVAGPAAIDVADVSGTYAARRLISSWSGSWSHVQPGSGRKRSSRR